MYFYSIKSRNIDSLLSRLDPVANCSLNVLFSHLHRQRLIRTVNRVIAKLHLWQ